MGHGLQREGWKSPFYWEDRDGHWFDFTLDGMREVDPAAPVCHVSYYEADAFAHWSRRSPAARRRMGSGCGAGSVDGNVPRIREAASATGVRQRACSRCSAMSGNGRRARIVAYPGFTPAAGAIGEYNGKFMCNQFVLRGGSCATPESHIRASYRNFFPPHARWQFMGIRLAK